MVVLFNSYYCNMYVLKLKFMHDLFNVKRYSDLRSLWMSGNGISGSYTSTKKVTLGNIDGGSELVFPKKIVCELQSKLAEHFILVSDKHAELIDSIEEAYDNIHDIIPDQAIKNLKIQANGLAEFMESSLNKSFEMVEKHILEHFAKRSDFPPRFVVKGPKDGKICDLFRKDNIDVLNSFEVDKNTAFKYVMDTGKYYFCNDIPEEIKSEAYENARIDTKQVRVNYQTPGFAKRSYWKAIGQPKIDNNWVSCWKSNNDNSEPYPETCYKSTLVVPMTLVNADLTEEFFKGLFGELSTSKQDKNKLIFGFICMDHRHFDYFKENEDVSIIYIIADMLALFLLVNYKFTIASNYYDFIQNQLKDIK